MSGHDGLYMQMSRKSVWDHVAGVASRWPEFLVNVVAIFTVIWTLAETSSYFLSANFKGLRFYAVAIGFSLLASGAWAIRSYVNDCPAGFENESQTARRIAQLQRRRWEFQLARQLLNDALGDLDDELDALSAERVFVPIEKRLGPDEYSDWIQLATENLKRMLGVATKLLVDDFAVALGSSDLDNKHSEIRLVVKRIRELYAESVAFERSRRAVLPPDGAERLQELQLGWSEPIRDGVRQLFDLLDQALAINKKERHPHIAFTVVMGEPENIEPFCAEFDRVRASRGWS